MEEFHPCCYEGLLWGVYSVQYADKVSLCLEVQCSVTLFWGVCKVFDDIPPKEGMNHLSMTLMK